MVYLKISSKFNRRALRATPEGIMKKILISFFAGVMLLAGTATAFAGGGHHHGGRDFLAGVIAGVIVAPIIRQGYQYYPYQQPVYQPVCWMENRPLYDSQGRYVTHQWVQVCQQP